MGHSGGAAIGKGTAILDGQAGDDSLIGGSGRNILIAGLGADSLTGGLNGSTRITTATAPNGAKADRFRGNAGLDWFFAYSRGETLIDKISTEVL